MSNAIPNFEHRVYETRLSNLVLGEEPRRHRVMICGGGPVGLGMALALARQGIASCVVDADNTVCQGSRAICLSRRSLDILDRLGALDGFLKKGLGWTTGKSFYKNTEVLRFDMSYEASDRFAPMTNIPQYYIEQFLVDAIEKHRDLIELRWGTELTGVSSDSDGVSVQLAAAGRTYSAGTEWLVACDGARSKVRQELRLRMNGTAYEGRYVIVDVEVDLGWPTERFAWFDPPSNPGRTMLMHRQPDNVWRLDYQLHDDEDAAEMTKPERVVPVVDAHFRMLGIDRPWRLVWSSTYRASALSLDNYVHDRVIFAGDAAHLVPIFGVRGLNSGFEDIFNLAWKLSRVLKGDSPREILNGYSLERRAAWEMNVEHAMKSTEFMAPPSRGFELMRDAVLSLAGRHENLRSLINPRQSNVLPYENSPMNVGTPDEHLFKGALHPGVLLPDAPVKVNGQDRHLSQCLADGFTVVAFPMDDAAACAISSAAQEASGSLRMDLKVVLIGQGQIASALSACEVMVEMDGRFRDTFDAGSTAVYLVRPDGYICARWRSVNARQLREALGLVAGCLPEWPGDAQLSRASR